MNEIEKQNLSTANQIKNLGYANLIIHITAIVFFIAWIITLVVTSTNLDYNSNNTNSLANVQIGFGIFIIIIAIVYFFCNLILGIIAIVKIASTNWQNDNLNQSKLVFWILSLIFIMMILVNPILWIVWGNKVKNTYTSSKESLK